MLVVLIHIRDPQFYALPAKTRSKNGRIRVMGFPPIGIMSLSAVLKRAGHECLIFDQAHPETPNDVIMEEIKRRQPALVGLSFLSTTSYPYAKILARQIRAPGGGPGPGRGGGAVRAGPARAQQAVAAPGRGGGARRGGGRQGPRDVPAPRRPRAGHVGGTYL